MQTFARVPSPGRIAEKTHLGEYHAPPMPRAEQIQNAGSFERVGNTRC